MCNADSIEMDTTVYLQALKKKLSDEIRKNVNSGRNIPEHHYMDHALMELKGLYKSRLQRDGALLERLIPWKSEDLDKITKLWNDISPEVQKHISERIKHYRSRRIAVEINQLTAKVRISESMDEAGLKYIIIPQTHRAKVAVKISSNNKLIFYLNYKKMNEELHRVVEAAKSMISLMESLGSSASVQKMMPYENW